MIEFDYDLVDNPALSFRARGVLLYLLATEPGTRLDSSKIAAAGTEGRDAIRNALIELQDLGYVQRVGTQWVWQGNPTRWTVRA
jgi:hypothetical protein